VSEIIWITIAFLCGSLLFSVWLGRATLGQDIRQFGDGNPGAVNVWRAGGMGLGLLAVLLDFLKGAIPIGLANFIFELDGQALVLVAIAPIAGHAFSPFLGFQGGKALAVTFGIWAGLSLWIVPLMLGILFGVSLLLIKPNAWAAMVGVFCLFVILMIIGNPIWIGVGSGMTLVLGWKHKESLSQKPEFRKYRRM